jgi:nucleoside-triphosphatase THEP1
LGEDNKPTRYTTKKVMDLEELLIGSVDKLHESVFHPLDADLVESIIANPLYPQAKSMVDKLKVKAGMGGKSVKLSDEQARALRYLTGSEGRIKVINGLAGTGKTTLLSAMEEAYRRQGYNIVGCSVAGVAAQGLQAGAGIESDTVAMRQRQLSPSLAWTFKHHAKQLWRAARKKRTYGLNRLKIDRRTVLVVDEAGMLGTEDFSKLARAVQKRGGILVCVGDHRQLPSISAGGGFEYIAKRVGQVDLQEIGRQTDHLQRELVKALVRGDAKLVLNLFAECGQLKVSENQDKTAERMIEDWKNSGGMEQPKDHVIVVATNREVERYNDLAQRELSLAGKLDLRQPVKVGEETMYPGDRILFTEKSRKLGVENGDRGVLIGVKDWGVGVTVAVRLDKNEKTVLIPLHRVFGESFHDFQRGYAFTTHKLQGATVDHSYIHVGGRMTTREMTYVQCSRNRETIHIYTEKLEAGRELMKLARDHEKQVLKRERKQERQEKLLYKLQREERYEQERREELVNAPMPSVDREREKESVLLPKSEPNKNIERTREENWKPSQEQVREQEPKLAYGHAKVTFEKLQPEQEAKQESFSKQNPTVEQEAKRTPEQQLYRERKPDFMQVQDLHPAVWPEIGREKPAEILKPEIQDRTEEIDQARKQEIKVSQNASGESRLEIEQKPLREDLRLSGQERQAEMPQSPKQTSSVEHDCSREIQMKVELEPIRESISKVGQERQPELTPTPRQVSQPEHEHSREKLQSLDREKMQEPLQAPKQEKKLQQDTSQEKPKSLEPEKKQGLSQPLKPERKVAPKQEKEVSPLIKQMTESRTKKLAHEILAESQKRQQEKERGRDMNIDR